MVKIKSQFWILKLRQLTKKTIHRWYGCKKIGSTSSWRPTTRELPKDRTEVYRSLEVVVDFSESITYKIKEKKKGKAYIVLFCNSLSKVLYLEILKYETLMEFLKRLKRFILRWRHPEKIYKDNGSTFLAAAKWLRKVLEMKDCMTSWLQLQFHASLILVEHHGGVVDLNGWLE